MRLCRMVNECVHECVVRECFASVPQIPMRIRTIRVEEDQ